METSRQGEHLKQVEAPKAAPLQYIVSKNRYRVPLTALINSRANGFAFINMAYTINIAKFFNLKI
jgi:hypothetical protein